MTDNIIPGGSSWQGLPIAHRMDWLTGEDTDDLVVRRELVAASVAALGDSWDNEIDIEWQDFQP